MLEKLMSVLLSPRRVAPEPANGGYCETEVGPCLGTNFLLKEGTLKFGAGGEVLRVKVSGMVGGDWPNGTASARVASGMFCGLEEPYIDCRYPWLDVGGLRVKIGSISGIGSSGMGTLLAIGGGARGICRRKRRGSGVGTVGRSAAFCPAGGD